ncbi:hypothetical protein EVAR_68041_1 [Eumeta japonica]|uniref:Uncharacterized protein n=1 Tax=Eumeta variegata TaxID=151549 RepID=A0A4C1ZUD9_EUMVA|nr:hypothetical protein EVAR_68041_1 [Eumeta japonica]
MIEAFNKVSINTDIKKSVEDKRISEKSVSKQQFTKLNEKPSNQKPIYDPTLKIPQYKIRANTDSKSIEKETEKPELKLTTAMEAGSCNIELLPKEIVDILGTMPVQHRNKLLNVLPQVFAKTVKQLKLAVDLNITKETITSPNKSEIATQTSNNMSEQTCPPEFVNVDTDKFLIDPVTGAIIERTNTENENSECLQNEKTIKLMTEDKKEEVNEELSSLKTKTDVLDNIDPSGTIMLANSCPIKQKASNDQTASLRAVRIKSANEKLKSSKNDYIPSATINVEKLSFEDSNKTTLKSNDLKNNQMEVNVQTTLAIQQFEVTSTQQNSCSYKQLSPTFVADIQKSISPVSGPILKSSAVLDISNSDEHTNLHTNKDKVSSDLTLVNVQLVSPNINTCPHNKTETKETNHQIIKNIVKSSSQDKLKSDEIKTLSTSETNQTYELSEATIILKDIDSSMKSSLLKSSTQKPTTQQNHNNGLCALDDDDDPEDDISLATILKQKIANQEKNNSTEKINNSVSRKSVKKRKELSKVNSGNSSEKVRNHTTGFLKKNKNQMLEIKVSPNTKNVSTPEGKMESCVGNQLNVANSQADLKKRSNKKKSKLKAGSEIINFDINKEIDQTSICQSNIEESKSKLTTQKNGEESSFNKLSAESKENDNDNYNNFKINIGKNSREEQLTLNNELTKKHSSFNKSITIDVLKDDNIISKKRVDKNKTEYADCIITLPIENNFHKVANIVSHSTTLLSNNEGIKIKSDSESITNENSKIPDENVDYIINSNQINTENAVSSTNTKNEAIYKFQKNKIKTQHTIEEIIKPHNLNQSLIHAQLDVHEKDNQIINLSSIKGNTEMKESGLSKENQTGDIEKDEITTGEICLLSKFGESSDVPLRRSRRGKSFYAESNVASLGEHLVSDNTSLQHKTPLTKKQVIFSKLLLDEENQFKPSNDVLCAIKEKKDILNVKSDVSPKAETNQSETKSLKRKLLPMVKKKIKKKKTIEEIVQARSNVVNSEKTLNVECIVLPPKSNITITPELPIVIIENDKNHDLILEDHNKISDNETNDLSSKTNLQNVSECQNFNHDVEKTNQQKSHKKKKQLKSMCVLNEKEEIENSLENRDGKQSTCNLNDNVVVPQQAIINDHSQVTISIPRLNIDNSLPENNNKLKFKSEKRKSSKSDKDEPDETSKKCKTDNVVASNECSVQIELHSQNDSANKNILTADDQSIAEELQLLDIQSSQKTQAKSKVKVGKSYSDLEYDDILRIF